MKSKTLLLFATLALFALHRSAQAQDDSIPAASLFSSMISGNAQGNAGDFQNASPRPDWGNPIFGEQMISLTHGAAILQRQNDNDSLIPINGMAGLELDAVLHLRDINLEFGWVGVFSGQTTQYLPAFAGGSLPTNPLIPFTSNGVLSTQYSSDLNSFEFNARVPVGPSFTGILGMRYINLYEAVHLTDNAPPTQALGWKNIASNNLFGLQAGGDLAFAQLGGFQMNAIAKGGVFVNNIENEGMVVGFPAPGSVRIHDQANPVAFVGELKLLATYRFTDYLSVATGYQMIWLDNIALAQNQFSAVNLASGDGINHSSNPLFHGALVQAIVSW